jgi:hypothetical protein
MFINSDFLFTNSMQETGTEVSECLEKCYANDPYARGYAACLSLPTIL